MLSRPGRELRPAPRSLVVLAGLPGAGKTTTLRRLAHTAGVLALDPEDVADRLARLPVPYRVLRPLVHAVHLLRVLRAVWDASPCVLTSDPLTSPLRRLLLRAAAHLARRQLYVVLVHATPAQARDGQQRRGRRLGERRMARHEQRYERLRAGSVDVVLDRVTTEQAELVLPHPHRAEPTRQPVSLPAPRTPALLTHDRLSRRS